MTRPIISVERLSKRFRIESTLRRTLRDRFTLGRRPQAVDPAGNGVAGAAATRRRESFWALRDVSFDVAAGEIVAIIGPNGAGKSTLLKVLSRITAPTEGRAILRGRFASLLEVGTGFHPEMSGRENVFLNGAILGMRRSEIASKLEAIVDFADIGPFLDTPVKRYSSGMHVRLAFAVAAHLDPDILIVDEVLAVGDALFQKKCLGKMQDVSTREGRTVLFVSHNMQAVQTLCGRGLYIEHGQIAADGPVTKVVSSYLAAMGSGAGERRWPKEMRLGNEFCRLDSISVRGASSGSTALLPSRDPIVIDFEFEVATSHPALCVGFDLTTAEGMAVLRSYQNDGPEDSWPRVRAGMNRWRCWIPPGLLNGGVYFVAPRIGLHNLAWIVRADAAVEFEVLLDHGVSPFWSSITGKDRPGSISPILEWQELR